MPFRKDMTGARVQFVYGKQVVFGTPIRPDTRLRLKLPEDLKANRTFDISDEPTPQRGRTSITETSRAANGPLNFDIRTEGLGAIYQAALGSDVDVVSLTDTNGGIRCQVNAQYDGVALTLGCDFIPSTFPAGGGDINIAYRTGGDTSAQLISVSHTYTSHAANVFTFAAAIPGALAAGDIDVEDYVFLTDAVLFSGVFTHMYVAGDALNTVSTFGILRDDVAFHYYSSKIGTFTETYDNQSVISGSVEVFAGDEFYGGILESAVVAGDTTLTILDTDRDRELASIMYPVTGSLHTCWIGEERLIKFTDVSVVGVMSGIPAAGVGSITAPHTIVPEREVVAFASVPNIPFTVSDSPLSSFNAGVFFKIAGDSADVASQEVLSADYTVENNLFTDKIPLGSKERIAIPEGIRDVTGKLGLEFDSPEEYNRVTRGTRVRLEIHGIDQLSTIGSTTVPKRNDTIFSEVQGIENTPTVPDTNLIEYDWNFVALVGKRWPEILKLTVNGQASAVAGG